MPALRGFAAVVCALAFHALLLALASSLGWLSPDGATLPELDVTSVDLSFSDAPDETAAPLAVPPPDKAATAPPPPPEPPPPEPPPAETPPDPHAYAVQPRAEPRPTSLRPALPEAPEPPPEPTPDATPRPAAAPVPDTPAPSQARVAADKPPVPRRRIKPDYPKGARQRGEEGDVSLELDISPGGTVDGVRIVASCGFAELEQAAVKAVRHARFTPARRGADKVPATVRLTLTFRLKD